MVYFIFICIYSFFTFLHNNSQITNPHVTNQYSAIYFFFTFFISLVVGLSGNEDEYTRLYILYPTIFDFFSGNYPIIYQKGHLFGFIASFFKTLGFNSQSIFLFFTFIGVFLMAIFVKKFTRYWFLAFLIYLSHDFAIKMYGGLRIGVASAMLLPMIYFLHNGKKIKFFLTLLAATLIQYVAILSIFLIFLKKRFKSQTLWFGLILAVVMLELDIAYDLVIFAHDQEWLPGIIADWIYDNNYNYKVSLLHPKTLQEIICVSLLIIFFNNKKNGLPKYFNLLFNSYYFGIILLITFSDFALFAFRFNGHFYSVEAILLTYFVYSFRPKYIVTSILLFFALAVAYVNYVIEGRVEPYKLFIN